MSSVTNLLGEIQTLQANKRVGGICTVASVKAAISKDENEALDQACGDFSIDAVTISTWLQAKGQSAKPWTVNRHRRKQCSCVQS
jgi:hypothetical protein